MALFTEAEAKYFYSGQSNSPRPPNCSFREWVNSLPVGQIGAGHHNLDLFRIHSSREIERLLILAASHYRRAHDLLSPISSPWAFVTLYYGSYFAASALLGSLGAWKLKGHNRLEPIQTAAPNQRFVIHKVRSSFSGSHERFWEFYFSHAVSLVPGATSLERFALTAISSDVTWLTSRRNDVNYDSYAACELAALHRNIFVPSSFPTSLPGNLNTQFRFLVSALTVANRVAKSVGINSDAISSLSLEPTRSKKVRQVVLSTRPPGLASRVEKKVAAG